MEWAQRLGISNLPIHQVPAHGGLSEQGLRRISNDLEANCIWTYSAAASAFATELLAAVRRSKTDVDSAATKCWQQTQSGIRPSKFQAGPPLLDPAIVRLLQDGKLPLPQKGRSCKEAPGPASPRFSGAPSGSASGALWALWVPLFLFKTVTKTPGLQGSKQGFRSSLNVLQGSC